jgi:ADP-heptose:LPS heptosyltransferase
MILSTGVMRAIARSYPTITMDVLASPANAAILANADYVGEVIVFDKKKLSTYLPTFRRLRGSDYDAVIDCMVTAPSVTTLLLIFASGARHRVGIAGRGNDSAFTITVPGETKSNAHMVDLLAALAPAFDVELSETDRRPVLELTAAEREWAESVWNTNNGIRVLINVSAGTSARLWATENYVAVMNHLRTREPSVVFRVIGAPAEAERADSIAHEGGGTFVKTPSIRDAFALVATSDFLFTPDTSIAHAASAFRVPTVAMYLRGTAERWRVYDTLSESVEHPDSTLAGLDTQTMIRAVDRVWDAATEKIAARRT